MPKYKKRADGRYATSIIIGYDGSKPIRKFFYAQTIRELDDKIADFRSLQNKGIIIDDKGITFETWAKKWLELYKSSKSYNTFSMYKYTLNKYLIPILGEYKLSTIKKHHLQELLNNLISQGHQRTAEIARITLKQIINSAIDEQYIFVDITRGLTLPKKIKKEKRALTDDEYNRLKSSIMPPKHRLFADILLYTGIRRGEALALKRNDINIANRTISINKNLIFKGNIPEIKNTPKSNSSIRDVVIPDALIESIKTNLPYCGEEYIFTMDRYDKIMSESSYRKMWKAISKAAQLPDDISAHNLRHNFATRLYYGGVDVKTAQKLLGHANIQITLDIYTHLSRTNADITDKINNIF